MVNISSVQTASKKLVLCALTAVLATAASSQAQSLARSQAHNQTQGRLKQSHVEQDNVRQNSIKQETQASSKNTQRTATPNWSTVEQNLIAEHSRVRQNPQSYLPILESHLASMDAQGNIPGGCGQNCTLLTQEGRSAVEEAIDFLRNQSPVGPVSASSNIARAAKAHATDQVNGAVGHNSSDGSSFSERLDSFGIKRAGVGENIAYGPKTARAVIMNLIIDDGVANRGHRTNIFAPDWAVAGAGCGPHATFRTVCVINYATH